jgi:hypothetical protein
MAGRSNCSISKGRGGDYRKAGDRPKKLSYSQGSTPIPPKSRSTEQSLSR